MVIPVLQNLTDHHRKVLQANENLSKPEQNDILDMTLRLLRDEWAKILAMPSLSIQDRVGILAYFDRLLSDPKTPLPLRRMLYASVVSSRSRFLMDWMNKHLEAIPDAQASLADQVDLVHTYFQTEVTAANLPDLLGSSVQSLEGRMILFGKALENELIPVDDLPHWFATLKPIAVSFIESLPDSLEAMRSDMWDLPSGEIWLRAQIFASWIVFQNGMPYFAKASTYAKQAKRNFSSSRIVDHYIFADDDHNYGVDHFAGKSNLGLYIPLSIAHELMHSFLKEIGFSFHASIHAAGIHEFAAQEAELFIANELPGQKMMMRPMQDDVQLIRESSDYANEEHILGYSQLSELYDAFFLRGQPVNHAALLAAIFEVAQIPNAQTLRFRTLIKKIIYAYLHSPKLKQDQLMPFLAFVDTVQRRAGSQEPWLLQLFYWLGALPTVLLNRLNSWWVVKIYSTRQINRLIRSLPKNSMETVIEKNFPRSRERPLDHLSPTVSLKASS